MAQRPDPDAAFFEDWSEWSDLGGGCYNYPPSRRKNPRYHCTLMTRVQEIDGPGFALRVHGNNKISDLLSKIGAVKKLYKPDYGYGYQAEARQWHYVPAARWRELRAILPEIKRITIDSMARYYGSDMSNYIVHATLNTGHFARHYRKDTEDGAVAVVSDMLDVLLQGAVADVPGKPGFLAKGTNDGRNLVVTLTAPDGSLLLTTVVCAQSRSSPRSWAMMHGKDHSLSTSPTRPPGTPWVADRIEAGALANMEAMRWSGSWARVLGWAWLEYVR